jgi:uncharacterized protein
MGPYMARNIINMILWHPDMQITETEITYIHRGLPENLKMITGDSIIRLERGFLILKEGSQIPFHRIVKITYNNKILWQKQL